MECMGMDVDNLIHMVNRIGQFFGAQPDRAEALADTALHLQRFWEPRMRTALLAHVDQGGAGLDPFVEEAVRTHRAQLLPAAARAPG
jgi:formate dehydrogenase subunit delta